MNTEEAMTWFATFPSKPVNSEAEELVPDSMLIWLDRRHKCIYFDGRILRRGQEDHNPLEWLIVATHEDWIAANGDLEALRKLVILNFDQTQRYDE